MENQHQKIKGYRELNQEEVDLMNRIKEKSEETGALMVELEQLRATNTNIDDPTAQDIESYRCLSVAKKELQTGFMWFVRAVDLPDSF